MKHLTILIALLILIGCGLPPTSITRMDPATAEFYGQEGGTSYRCTLMDVNKFGGAAKSLSLNIVIPDDTALFGMSWIIFSHIDGSWAFINSVEMKIGSDIHTIHFRSPSRSVTRAGGVLCVENGHTMFNPTLIESMLTKKVTFRFGGEVYDMKKENLLAWWESIPPYWQNRLTQNKYLE